MIPIIHDMLLLRLIKFDVKQSLMNLDPLNKDQYIQKWIFTHLTRIKQSLIRKAWNPPQRGYFKVNVDAATNSEKQISGLGAVIRDENGNVIAAAIKVSRFYGEAAYAEAEAIDWGLQIANRASLSSLVVESDAQEVVQLVNNNQGCRSEIYWIISEVQSLLKNFDSISVEKFWL